MKNTKRKQGKELYEQEKALFEYQGATRVVTSKELQEKLKEDNKGQTLKFDTGLSSLDRILGGVEVGELITVTGLSGQGKTTMLMSITKNLAAAGEKAVWFTLEVTPAQFIEKMSDREVVPDFLIPIATADMMEDDYVSEWERKHGRRYETMDWVEDKIVEAKVKFDTEEKPLRFVFIDHVHMLFSLNENRNVSLEIGDLVARIKYWAISKGLVVFLVSHCRDVTTEMSAREPRMADIRDSGMISRLSDSVVGVWRIKNDNDGSKKKLEALGEDDNKTKVMVFKNRRTGKLGYFTAYVHDHYLSEDPFGGDI